MGVMDDLTGRTVAQKVEEFSKVAAGVLLGLHAKLDTQQLALDNRAEEHLRALDCHRNEAIEQIRLAGEAHHHDMGALKGVAETALATIKAAASEAALEKADLLEQLRGVAERVKAFEKSQCDAIEKLQRDRERILSNIDSAKTDLRRSLEIERAKLAEQQIAALKSMQGASRVVLESLQKKAHKILALVFGAASAIVLMAAGFLLWISR